MNCELCRLYENREIVTRLYHEDDVCIVINCKVHNVPILVLKRHTAFPTQEELSHLKKIALKLFPEMHFRDSSSGSIRDHFHLHET